MKKIHLLFLLPFFLCTLHAYAVMHTVMVQNRVFIPATLNVNVGDIIQWTLVDGSAHTTTSLGIPGGAAAWNSPVDPTIPTFSYTVTVAGTYNYQCNFHVGSGMAGGFTATVLPLELRSFTGKTVGSINWLYWETLTEKDVESHIVERSPDSKTWTEVGHRPGSANSTVVNQYELEDQRPFSQTYYRLRSVDFDGKNAVSKVILLGEAFSITKVFPNPVVEQVTVQFFAMAEEQIRLSVVDITGKVVWFQIVPTKTGLNTTVVPLRQLQSGAYDLILSNGRKSAAPLRVIKE